jgi:hypothetical protein
MMLFYLLFVSLVLIRCSIFHRLDHVVRSVRSTERTGYTLSQRSAVAYLMERVSSRLFPSIRINFSLKIGSPFSFKSVSITNVMRVSINIDYAIVPHLPSLFI